MCNNIKYCPICGKVLNELELLCDMDTCFDCVDEDYHPEEVYQEEDEDFYYLPDDDDYKELNFN